MTMGRGEGRDGAAVLSAVCAALGNGQVKEAEAIVVRDYPFVHAVKGTRQYTPLQCMTIFIRDGFIDRYTGQRLVFPGTLRLISQSLPEAVPYHRNWKMDSCHPAYYDLFPTVDHVVPVARGGSNAVDNLVSTSMAKNAIKANFTVNDLGWKVLPPSGQDGWDGLTGWFFDQINKDDNLLNDPYLRKWFAAAERALQNQASNEVRADDVVAPQSPLEKLAALLPVFTAPGFSFGEWAHSREVAPNTFTMPFYIFSSPADALSKTCCEDGWVRSDFDWGEWKQTPEAVELLESPDALARATTDQLSKLLTVIIRQEKFCDGAMASAYDSGLITAILRRAVSLCGH